MAKNEVKEIKKKKVGKSTLAVVILSIVVLAFIIYFIIGAVNQAQTQKLNNAAVYGANVRDVQLFAGSANCQPVMVMAFDEQGNQMQKPLMEISPECFATYQQAAAQIQALQQQAASQQTVEE